TRSAAASAALRHVSSAEDRHGDEEGADRICAQYEAGADRGPSGDLRIGPATHEDDRVPDEQPPPRGREEVSDQAPLQDREIHEADPETERRVAPDGTDREPDYRRDRGERRASAQ